MSPRPFSRRDFLQQAAGLAALGSFARAAESPAPAAAVPGIIDAHVHVWKKDPRYPWAPETANPPAQDATAEMLLDLMQRAGVAQAVLIQVIHYRWDNRYVADMLRQYPQKFRGVARVDPEDPAAPDRLAELTREGFRGVRLSPGGGAAGDWIRGPLMPPLWRRCQELGVPMTLLAPITRMPDVGRLVDRFPELTVVIDHMADSPLRDPAALEALLALRRFPRVHVKISHTWTLSAEPYPYVDAHAQVRRLYDAFGPQRLIAGSDWPLVERHCTYAEAIDIARSRLAFLNADDKRWICGETARRVWFG